tara:strand:- start:11043 stop:11459 length:417 start_codon:yes stop_codon:yes gene_type:complete
MSLTLTKTPAGDDVWGRHRVWVGDVKFDSSYPAGGEAVAAGDFTMGSLMGVQVLGGNAAAAAYMMHFDSANSKLMLTYPTGGATTAPAAVADPIVTTGSATASVVDATTPNITPGRGKELRAATDASTITFRILAVGL